MQLERDLDQRIQFNFYTNESENGEEIENGIPGEIFWNLTDNKVLVEYRFQEIPFSDDRNISFRDVLVFLNIGFSDESVIDMIDNTQNINNILDLPILQRPDVFQCNIYRNRNIFNRFN